MRRWVIATLFCLPGIPLVGQDRLIVTPQPAHSSPRNASIVSDPAPTLVATESAFPTLATISNETSNAEPSPASGRLAGPTVTVTSSLAVVLGLFAGLVWITRKFGARTLGNGTLPRDVLQSLGSTSIDPRTRITMLRCGGRILVVAQTQSGIQPLSEITDPEEVRRLTAACSADSKQSFSSTIRSLEQEPVDSGFVGTTAILPSRAVVFSPPRKCLGSTL